MDADMAPTAQRRFYKRAPITEAAIDVRTTLGPEFPLRRLRETVAGLESLYPVSLEGFEISTTLTPDGTQNTKKTPTGFQFKSKDEKYALQTSLKGFTFSRLAPYERWESFRDAAAAMWSRYKNVTSPLSIDRAAVRYINRIDLPLPVLDLGRYLTVRPEVPSRLGANTQGFLMQLQLALPDIDAHLILNEASTPPVKTGFVSIVLDLDLFRTSTQSLNDAELWNTLDSLHDRVEEAFEMCITDDTRRLVE
jgi:uncharacterized protein (TIGR04255 family)